MNLPMYLLFFAVSLAASTTGNLCGMGGGVLSKPILDATGALGVASISFLSACTVLSMSGYSVIRTRISGESLVDKKIGTPLALGAAAGGIIGKVLFRYLADFFPSTEHVGAVQSACLLVFTLGCLLFTLRKSNIRTLHVKSLTGSGCIGLLLGITSSFLGIGGGPINLVVLFYFFSMETKTAAQNSLYIIVFCQAASILNTIATGTLPPFRIGLLVLMVCGGLLGGVIGRRINKRISENTVSRIFMSVMLFILVLCSYNCCQFIRQ